MGFAFPTNINAVFGEIFEENIRQKEACFDSFILADMKL